MALLRPPLVDEHPAAGSTAGCNVNINLSGAGSGIPQERLNQLMEFDRFLQSGGTFFWSPKLDYIKNCEIYGSNNRKYVALKASGPGVSGVGPKDPVSGAGQGGYWAEIGRNTSPEISPKGLKILALSSEETNKTAEEKNSNSQDTWIASELEAQLLENNTKAITPRRLADAFKGANQRLERNGYQKLPGGMILQWGITPLLGYGQTANITYPISFPNACTAVVTTIERGIHDQGINSSIYNLNRSFFTINACQATGAQTAYHYWQAIGY